MGDIIAIKIFIDQGHNPSNWNTGALGNNLKEQDITYNVGIYLQDLLEEDPRFEVKVSRNSPTEVLGTSNSSSLVRRVVLANQWPADYFISIHANASTNTNANGSEVYVYKQNSPSYQLATDVLENIVKEVGTKNNGVRINPSLFVLRRTKMPAILVELGYITNTKDAILLKNMQYEFAYGIYLGLLEYLNLKLL